MAIGTIIGIVGIGIAVLIFGVQELRGKASRRQLRKDIADYIEKKLPALLESRWKAQNPDKPITPEIRAEFINFAKETSSTIAAGGIPPAGSILAGDTGDSPVVFPDPKKSAAERQDDDKDDKPPAQFIFDE